MSTTIRRDNQPLLGQRPNLVMHVLNGTEAAMQHKHWSSAAVGFKIDPYIVDVEILSPMCIARDCLPNAKPKPPSRYSIERIDFYNQRYHKHHNAGQRNRERSCHHIGLQFALLSWSVPSLGNTTR